MVSVVFSPLPEVALTLPKIDLLLRNVQNVLGQWLFHKVSASDIKVNFCSSKVELSNIKIKDTDILNLFPRINEVVIKNLVANGCYEPYPDELINEFIAQIDLGLVYHKHSHKHPQETTILKFQTSENQSTCHTTLLLLH